MPEPEGIARLLLTWYTRHARDLPWRRTSDPYAVWISEVMLQQTQVQTVIPYWERWMRELPDVASLAMANPDHVLKLWEGLGYYTRARNLHRAAQAIVEQHDGVFPTQSDALLALPGIGRYTAGAICSIAFNQPAPILDGNAVRVLTRIFGVTGNVSEKRVTARLWRLSLQLVQAAERIGVKGVRACSSLNQGIMELGATVCRATNPECRVCPVSSLCSAWQTGRTGQLPNLTKRLQAVPRHFAAFAVSRNGRVLVRQRPGGVVNAHLWEFPNLEITGKHVRVEESARECLGCAVDRVGFLCTIRHSITRYRIQLDVYRVDLNERTPKPLLSGTWCNRRQLETLAFPSAHRKIVAAL